MTPRHGAAGATTTGATAGATAGATTADPERPGALSAALGTVLGTGTGRGADRASSATRGAALPASTGAAAGVRRRSRRPLGTAAGAWLAVVVVTSVAAPLIAPYPPGAQDLAHVLSGPSASHWLGTGVLGQDELSRLLYGGRVTLLGVAVSDTLYVAVGVPLGLAAGYLGGWVERVALRLADVVYSVPLVVVLLVVMAVFPGNELVAMVGLGLLGAPGLARVVRSRARALRHEPYVRAARAAGLRPATIMRRHVLPQVAGTVVVQLSLFSAAAALLETGLGFLGVGTTGASWGGLVSEASQNLGTQPWLLVPSGFVIISFVLSLGLVGDTVRDTLAALHGDAGHPLPAATSGRARAGGASATVDAPPAGPAPGALLSVRGLTVTFGHRTTVVTDVDLDVLPGEAVGIVGESGCGKTVTALALLGLLGGGGQVTGGSVRFDGEELVGAPPGRRRQVLGSRIGWVPQEPTTSLDPSFTVGSQVAQAVRLHSRCSRRQARQQALDLLRRVGFPTPHAVARQYPHQLSGGMAQRVNIATALAGDPVLLVADEPTTALDVTVQADILDLLRDLQEAGTAIVLVTHDWGVLADVCQRAVVMYAGQVVEEADVAELVAAPRHPYTAALAAADPRLAAPRARLAAIGGTVPTPAQWPEGCRFEDRCPHARPDCGAGPVPVVTVAASHRSRCRHPELLPLSSPPGPRGPVVAAPRDHGGRFPGGHVDPSPGPHVPPAAGGTGERASRDAGVAAPPGERASRDAGVATPSGRIVP